MVNFTKLTVLAFGAAVMAKPVETGIELLEKRANDAGPASHWPSIQTCYDALCNDIDNGYMDRCESITKCSKYKDGGCKAWYCPRVENTRYITHQ